TGSSDAVVRTHVRRSRTCFSFKGSPRGTAADARVSCWLACKLDVCTQEEIRLLKVLVADDQPTVCATLDVLFALPGLEPLTARPPDEALIFIRSEDIGVVVQDMNLHRDATSGEEGEALLRAIRELDPELPVLLMTAFQSLEAAVRLVKGGASDYIAKPW